MKNGGMGQNLFMTSIALSIMICVCPWSDIFSRPKGKPYALLYWYLFNKSDYQSSIADKLRKLKKLEIFEDVPSSITHERHIGSYLHEMEEYNLIGRINTDKKPYYFQALSFFYLDPFCIKTPKAKEKDIEAHYVEYSNCVGELELSSLEILEYLPLFAFNLNKKNNSVLPAQRIVQYYSSDPMKFMNKLLHRRMDHISLYELIKASLRDVSYLFHSYMMKEHQEDFYEMVEDFGFPQTEFYPYSFFDSFAVLDKEKAVKMPENSRIELIKQYDIAKWFGWDKLIAEYRENEEELPWFLWWNNLTDHVTRVREYVDAQLNLYQKIERGYFLFNKKTLKFESP